VAEWTKVSVATRTVTGSNSATGGIFLLEVKVSGERGRHPPPGHGRYLTGAHLKILQKQIHCLCLGVHIGMETIYILF